MTATSWTSSTEKLASPPCVRISPFSVSVWTMIAVELSARTMPTANAVCQGWSASSAMPVSTSVVSTTCPPPSPASLPRIAHSRLGSISSPMMNNIITTPNSAKTCSASTSTDSAASSGAIAMPASR